MTLIVNLIYSKEIGHTLIVTPPERSGSPWRTAQKNGPHDDARGGQGLRYLNTPHFQAVGLLYGESGSLEMYILLPGDVEEFLESLSLDECKGWINRFE